MDDHRRESLRDLRKAGASHVDLFPDHYDDDWKV